MELKLFKYLTRGPQYLAQLNFEEFNPSRSSTDPLYKWTRGLLERQPSTGVDVVSLVWTIDMAEGRRRLGRDVAVQGNADPGVLFGSKEFNTNRINDARE